MNGFLIPYLIGSFSKRTVLIYVARNSGRLRVNVMIISSGIYKLQATSPQYKKPQIPNSDASDLVSTSGRRKKRQFIDRPFEVTCMKWYLQSTRTWH